MEPCILNVCTKWRWVASKNSGTHRVAGSWKGLRAGLDIAAKGEILTSRESKSGYTATKPTKNTSSFQDEPRGHKGIQRREKSKKQSCPATPCRRQEGEEMYVLLILNLSTRWGEGSASLPDRASPYGKGPPVPTGQEAGWASDPVWTQRLEEQSFAPAWDQTPVVRL
jgi:hypothetical protein